jgi:hypothetical protein
MCGNMEIVKDIILTKQAKLLQQTDKRWAQLYKRYPAEGKHRHKFSQ